MIGNFFVLDRPIGIVRLEETGDRAGRSILLHTITEN